jgi:hypothetical protein
LPPNCQDVERTPLLVRKAQCGREAIARVAMDGSPQSPLNVADCASADTGSLCQFLLGHCCSQTELLERGAQLVLKSHGYPQLSTHLADLVTQTVG